MSEPFLGEIRIFSFGFAPRGWAACNGQTMSIPQNQALFSLLGVIYGGDGRTNFNLPNLQGRVPFHVGAGYPQGKSDGEAAHKLLVTEMPGHTHTATGSAAVADLPSPVSNYWAAGANTAYAAQRSETMSPTALANAGSDQSHDNMSPYLALNFCIALMGIYPPRS